MDFRRALRLTTTALLLGAGPALIPLHSAMAQSSPGGGDADREAADQQAKAAAKEAARLAAPPPAIPGAVTDEATATSGHANVDMEPTAALFDSINRGDMTAAKESLGRGADMNGKNVLGQSPLEMSIDLNRNDITFVLLSMRNTENGAPVASIQSASVSEAGSGNAAADHAGKTHLKVKGDHSHLAAGSSPKPQRYAADGGVPKPEIGFLGFGGS